MAGKKGNTNGFKKGLIPWNKGKTTPIETKEKQRLAKLLNPVRYWLGKERIAMKGNKFCEGIKHTDEWKEEARKRMIGNKYSVPPIHKGSDCHFWKGGISNTPYTCDWTKTLKRSIRERDNYTCQICGKIQTERVFSVHHIDYQKENCNPNNLVTLCQSCHAKTNNHRDKWIMYFRGEKI